MYCYKIKERLKNYQLKWTYTF